MTVKFTIYNFKYIIDEIIVKDIKNNIELEDIAFKLSKGNPIEYKIIKENQ